MTTTDILTILQRDIHTTVFATVDARGLPQTFVIDLMLADEDPFSRPGASRFTTASWRGNFIASARRAQWRGGKAMAKTILLTMLCLLLPLAGVCEAQKDVRVIVATDLHYLVPELTDGGPFFQRLIEQADGKVMAYSEALIEAFVQQVIDRKPDALILSGDLTFNGERASHEALAEKLLRVERAGIDVLVIPGNHDLNSKSAVRFAGEGYERVDSVTAADFAQIYRPFGFDGALSRDDASLSSVFAVGDRLRVLMVDVNTAGASNRVTERTAAWIGAQLADAREAGCRVIAVSHQNLLNHSSLLSSGFTIENAATLRALYADSPVVCNLSGHIHMQHTAQSDDGLWDIATSSLAVSPNQYGMLTLTEKGLSYRTEAVDVSSWARARALDDPNLLNFADYAADFFKDTARRQTLAAITEGDHRAQLADFFAEINAAYFAGRMDRFTPDARMLSLWQQQPAFFARYIDSIAQEGPRNHCELTLAY